MKRENVSIHNNRGEEIFVQRKLNPLMTKRYLLLSSDHQQLCKIETGNVQMTISYNKSIKVYLLHLNIEMQYVTIAMTAYYLNVQTIHINTR